MHFLSGGGFLSKKPRGFVALFRREIHGNAGNFLLSGRKRWFIVPPALARISPAALLALSGKEASEIGNTCFSCESEMSRPLSLTVSTTLGVLALHRM